ncbi:MAG: VOC family protein, partial [Clostridia bacterium]|nr:VOC family protein [Clostridia bacterium]
MAGTVGTHLFAQVGFIVNDIEETKKKWAAFLGVEVPETQLCGDYAVMQTTFEGKPAPEANSLLAFFDVGPGLQLELIQPNEAPSTWRNFLNEHGEGMHHIAFQVRDSVKQVANAEAAGLKLV